MARRPDAASASRSTAGTPAPPAPTGPGASPPGDGGAHAGHGPAADASSEAGVAFIEPRALPIERATDLGSVQVLKHGNLYLLTDPFGDIHPDSRGLGLYLSDTRLLSCLWLRSEERRVGKECRSRWPT